LYKYYNSVVMDSGQVLGHTVRPDLLDYLFLESSGSKFLHSQKQNVNLSHAVKGLTELFGSKIWSFSQEEIFGSFNIDKQF